MAWVASGVALAGGIYSADQQANAAENAAEGQQNASNLSLAEMQRQFNLQQNQMQPWMQAGRGALAEQQALMGLGGDTQGSLASLMNSPGYQFRLQEGQRGLEGGLAARGGMGSGKAMTAATQYGQNFASNEYGNRLNQLAGLSGTGQSAASNMGNAGMNYAGNVSNVLTGNANAQGAAGMAGANARQSGILGGAQLGLNLYDYMNRSNTGNNWANNNNPNYNGAGFPDPYTYGR